MLFFSSPYDSPSRVRIAQTLRRDVLADLNQVLAGFLRYDHARRSILQTGKRLRPVSARLHLRMDSTPLRKLGQQLYCSL